VSGEIDAQLEALEAGALAALLLKRAGTDGDFRLWLETELAALSARETRKPLDPEPFRRRAAALLDADRTGRRERHWDDGRANIDEAALEELIAQAVPFLDIGDGNNALAILRPIAGSLAEYWPQCAEWDETLHEFFPQLDRMIAQAVLLDGVSQAARDELADELSAWQDEVAEYGADDAFAVAIAAAARGWDEPGLNDVLGGQGRIWPLAGNSNRLDDQLTTVRLDALEAMGRADRFLNLSLAAGHYCDHAIMLAKGECFDEALALARARLHDSGGVLRLAGVLLEMHQRDAAIEFAVWGLSLPTRKDGYEGVGIYGRHALACWLRDQAQAANRSDFAVMAARTAFGESLSREDFGAAERLCPADEWPDVRAALLRCLVDADHAHDRIDILLDENLTDEAIAAVERKGDGYHSPYDETLMRLADAACALHPDWTIRFAYRMATPIMTEGRSSHYDLAVRWLEKAARAHAVAGKCDEWRARLNSLIETHRRKHKLRALLEALRTTG
jgi:uncharacterized Zn finger protein